MWGLQKYFAADGEFVKQIGDDNSIRILRKDLTGYPSSTLTPNRASQLTNTKPLSEEELYYNNSVRAYPSTESNKELVLENWAKKYQGLSSRYSNSEDGDREYAMALFSKEITGPDGVKQEVFIEGSTAKGFKGVDGISLTLSKSPISGWEATEAIHTHRYGKDPKDFSDDPGWGNRYQKGDIQTALELNIPVYLVVPYSNWIGKFDPNKYNELRSNEKSHEVSKLRATSGSSIYISN